MSKNPDYFLHWTQSGLSVLIIDIWLGTYGDFDYIVITEGGISRGYLTTRGMDEAYQFGEHLLDEDFFEKIKQEARQTGEELKKYTQQTFTDQKVASEWERLIDLWDKTFQSYLFCEEPMLKPIEEVVLAECGEDGAADLFSNDPKTELDQLSLKARYAVTVLKELGEIKLELHTNAEALMTEGMDAFEEFLSQQYDISRDEFQSFRKDEVETLFSSGGLPDMDVVRARMPGSAFIQKDGEWQCVHGDAFREVKERVEGVGSDVVEGKVAYPGKVRGKVVTHMSWTDVTDVPPGGVLVTGMTNPQMIPHLKNAAAIITDEGGITCHAAIVSRELKKPCIIGTQNATKILHDGDEVEVDADNGVVTIITKK